MPTSSAGKTSRAATVRESGHDDFARSGVTLIEMLVVVALISLMVGVAYPPITSGIDSLRLKAAANGVVSFLDYGLSRAERRQQMVDITISKAQNFLEMRSREQGFYRKLQLPEGISIVQVLPELPEESTADANAPREFLLYPGGTVPPLGLQLINRRNVQRVVRVDPITGVPRVEAPPTNE
jgi:prepilin-type N-terminal cleavage/methylation domain-containing protein